MLEMIKLAAVIIIDVVMIIISIIIDITIIGTTQMAVTNVS